jgi:hypothetical protein
MWSWLGGLTDRPRWSLLADAALAGALLAGYLLISDPVPLLRATTGGLWPPAAVPWVWWTTTAATVAAVALRRRWPVPALATAALTAALRLTTGLPVGVLDLAVPLLVYTVAAQRPRRASLTALVLLLTGTAALSASPAVTRPFATLTFQVCERHITPRRPGPGERGDCRAGGNQPVERGARRRARGSGVARSRTRLRSSPRSRWQLAVCRAPGRTPFASRA